MPDMAPNFSKESCMQNEKYFFWCWLIGTMFGPCSSHNMAMFWLFLQYLCFKMPKRRKLCNAVISTILWPFLSYIRVMFCWLHNIFASRCRKWLKLSLQSYMLNKRKPYVEFLRSYWGHVWPILRPCSGNSYQNFASIHMKVFKSSLNFLLGQKENYHVKSNK